MDNLLLNENCQLLLTYFYQNEGVSSDSCIHKALNPKALDEHFVAPERPLTLRSDWWSYGVILYELFLGLVSFKFVAFNLSLFSYFDFTIMHVLFVILCVFIICFIITNIG